MRISRRKIILLLAFLLVMMNLKPVLSKELVYSYTNQDRDPFTPLINKYGLILIYQEVDVKGLSLKGIIYENGQSLAIINDEVLRIGDKIGLYKIIKIGEKEVVLKKGKEVSTLKLEEE
ncbi:MAG: hypothetical protein KAJ79_03830 [Candidatus Omnitrophica bacterium]|nr:hypothetical protein [Candidatus Omnitrophota bacterium]MCK5288168.1 hypothetical protein [Candidatus Omnitrophota bacterium]